MHWACFYANCSHTLHPVSSGHRLALVYNLYAPNAAQIAPPSQRDPIAGLGALAAKWTEWASVKKLVHLCDAKAERWEALTGRDKALAQCLHECGAFDVFLVKVDVADLETTYDSDCDDDGGEDASRRIEASLWLSRGGLPPSVCAAISKVTIDSEEFAQGRYWKCEPGHSDAST